MEFAQPLQMQQRIISFGGNSYVGFGIIFSMFFKNDFVHESPQDYY